MTAPYEAAVQREMNELAAKIARLEEANSKMLEALNEIARQKTMTELEGELDGCDFDYAYDKMIEVARAAIAAAEAQP